jgi:large subunit ribosomal protein L19
MLVGGYLGEAGYVNAMLGFIIGMAGWIYILYEIFSGEAGKAAAKSGRKGNKMNVIDKIEKDQMDKISAERSLPEFGAGDTLKVDVKIVEGDKERVQAFEGLCIARSGGGLNESFTVRKISYGEGVERIFPIFSPKIAGITVLKRGKVRRAKLYYLRDRRGKSARIVEKIQVSKKEIKPKSDNKKVTEEAASKD